MRQRRCRVCMHAGMMFETEEASGQQRESVVSIRLCACEERKLG